MTRLLYGLCGEDRARRFSPHVWKVEMALAHKGLDCRVVPLAFTEIPEVEGGATKTVPYLVDGDHAVVDSFAIAQHLDVAYPDRATLFGETADAQPRGSSRPFRRRSCIRPSSALSFSTSMTVWAPGIAPISARAGKQLSGRRSKRSRPQGRQSDPPSPTSSCRCVPCSRSSRSSAETHRSLRTTSSSAPCNGPGSSRLNRCSILPTRSPTGSSAASIFTTVSAAGCLLPGRAEAA